MKNACLLVVVMSFGLRVAHGSELHVPGEFETIQAAVDAAVDGDSVLIAAGTYNESVSLKGKTLSLIGEGPDVTILDGTGLVTTILAFPAGSGRGTTVKGLSVRNADMTYPQGAVRILKSRADFLNCNFSNNIARPAGGALMVDAWSDISLTNCAFTSNTTKAHSFSASGGAIYFEVAAPPISSTPAVLTNCTFVGNSAIAQSGGGGAVYSKRMLKCINCTFHDNHTTGGSALTGGAIQATRDLELIGCTFTSNSKIAVNYVAGYAAPSSISLQDCVFDSNQGGWSGGLYVDSIVPGFSHLELSINGCIFNNNSGVVDGGALNASGDVRLALSDSVFVGNAADASASAVAVIGFPWVSDRLPNEIDHCVFIGNTAINGNGALAFQSSDSIVSNCEFTENTGKSYGALISNSSEVTLLGVVACENSPKNIGGPWIDGGENEICDPASPADFNGDHVVDGIDLGLLLEAWGQRNPDFDLNGDGLVAGNDLGLLLADWS